jgi:hypothetical protein
MIYSGTIQEHFIFIPEFEKQKIKLMIMVILRDERTPLQT